MKIRIMGTVEELNLAVDYYKALEMESYVKAVSLSQFYPNRGSSTVYRLYVDIEYYYSEPGVIGIDKKQVVEHAD